MKVTQTGSCLATFFDIVAMVLLGIYAANVLSQESKKTILQFAIFTALGLSGRNLGTIVLKKKYFCNHVRKGPINTNVNYNSQNLTFYGQTDG